MTGIQFVTDENGRKVGVLIGLKTHGAIWEDFSDGLISEARREEKGIPYGQYRSARLRRAPRTCLSVLSRDQALGAKGIGCHRRATVNPHRPVDPGAGLTPGPQGGIS
jgi:hypothetical protein